MKVEAFDPFCSPQVAASANVDLVSSLSELLEISDFLTIHTPLIASTKGMIGTKELRSMKKGARILNVARGGMIDEDALLAALESGHIAGAGIDVFTSEPPQPESSAAKLIAHPRVTATPHLGASTVEAQENVSIDVCEQVILILGGDLPRSAVNAPMILPEEYKTLQPFVRLVEKIGSLYTQHYATPHREAASYTKPDSRTTFDLIYEGSLATLSNTKPLFAALIKGLTTPFSDDATNVNIVNAELIARDRGIVINEQHSRGPSEHNYSSLVTLRARPAAPSRASSRRPGRPQQSSAADDVPGVELSKEQVISGYVSASQIFISRIDRFSTSFVPEGNLLICHNFDSPGKIGVVGGLLGKEGVNINFMSVAPVSRFEDEGTGNAGGGSEALMILGVDREVGKAVVESLAAEEGILEVSAVAL
jgi:D-3-phosphoglycerate dehydrogenase